MVPLHLSELRKNSGICRGKYLDEDGIYQQHEQYWAGNIKWPLDTKGRHHGLFGVAHLSVYGS